MVRPEAGNPQGTEVTESLHQALEEHGFVRTNRDTYCRSVGAEVEHFVLFDGVPGRGTKVSVAIRHRRVEATYVALYPSIADATPKIMEIIATHGGYTAGIELGMANREKLEWNASFASWIGANLTIAGAIGRIDKIRSLQDIHAMYLVQGPYSETWVSRTTESWVRHAIILELDALEGNDADAAELDRVAGALEHAANKAHWSKLGQIGLTDLRRRIRSILESPS